MAITSIAGDWAREVIGEGEEGAEKVWIMVLLVSPAKRGEKGNVPCPNIPELHFSALRPDDDFIDVRRGVMQRRSDKGGMEGDLIFQLLAVSCVTRMKLFQLTPGGQVPDEHPLPILPKRKHLLAKDHDFPKWCFIRRVELSSLFHQLLHS